MLHVIGAGLPRTGTFSLRQALSTLLGGPCYHMAEVFERPEHIATWQGVLDGEDVDWHEVLDDYAAAVDWPAAAFWPEIAAAFPEAHVLLSERVDGRTWWRSAESTVLQAARGDNGQVSDEWRHMARGLWSRLLGEGWADVAELNAAQGEAAYRSYVEWVRDTAPADRLIVWRPEEGWGPLCEALGLREPPQAFPHLNAGSAWKQRPA